MVALVGAVFRGMELRLYQEKEGGQLLQEEVRKLAPAPQGRWAENPAVQLVAALEVGWAAGVDLAVLVAQLS